MTRPRYGRFEADAVVLDAERDMRALRLEAQAQARGAGVALDVAQHLFGHAKHHLGPLITESRRIRVDRNLHREARSVPEAFDGFRDGGSQARVAHRIAAHLLD